MASDPHPALDGATTALRRRIEELTAELSGATQAHHMLRAELEDERSARWRLQAARDAQLERAEKAEADVRTARAAREQAEKAVRLLEQSNDAKLEMWQQAERERETALERVASQDADLAANAEAFRSLNDRALAAESALASAREHVFQQLEAAREEAAHEDSEGLSFQSAADLLLRPLLELLSSPPSPALCSGCAAAQKLLDRVSSVRDRLEFAAGEVSAALIVEKLNAALSPSPAPVAHPDTEAFAERLSKASAAAKERRG